MKADIETIEELVNKEKPIRVIYFGDWWDDRWRRRLQFACRLAQLKGDNTNCLKTLLSNIVRLAR